MLNEKKHKKLCELLELPTQTDGASLTKAFAHHLEYTVGKFKHNAQLADIYQALAYTIRDYLIDRWNETQENYHRQKIKKVYYLSLEFLPGRLLKTNLVNMDMLETTKQAMEELGFNLDEICEYEPDAGLGNGGLGRLAACFLDSMSTLDLPCCGTSLRYEFGIFNQQILNGYQRETPDNWLARGNPWEIRRGDIIFPVNFYGRTQKYVTDSGEVRVQWLPDETVMAMAYDILIPGHDTLTVSHLRLWAANPSQEFNFDYFSHGDYIRAVEDKFRGESIFKVLYPNDNNLQGRELRLKQEYLLVSATLQDAIAGFQRRENDWNELPNRVFFQLNDTHPALAVAELMYQLVDQQGLPWDQAWQLTTKCFGYTNHTVLPEALERWDLELMGNLLPRHLEIMFEINHRFLDMLRGQGVPEDAVQRMSIIEEGPRKTVRMANLAIIGAKAVNGVAAMHSEIVKSHVFPDFYKVFPEKFQNKTNGITHRRWIVASNPELTELISERIGKNWIANLDGLQELKSLALDESLQERWREIKKLNKQKLIKIIQFECGITLDPDSLFDIQIKRIHEYKRQLLNILRVIRDFQNMKANPRDFYQSRSVIFAGKAAPGYRLAKMIIKLIHAVGQKVNNDPDVNGRLKVVFLPNYRVSLAERLFPAADLSEQISTAGYEASGTGNMKFMLNGAITVGTMDGANVEIREEVGDDNIYIFGKLAEEITESRAQGYDPAGIYRHDDSIRRVLDALKGNYFNPNEAGIFDEIFGSLVYHGDIYHTLEDFPEYCNVQDQIGRDYSRSQEWTRKSIMNTASSGKFSSDRTVAQYAEEIWDVKPVKQRTLTEQRQT